MHEYYSNMETNDKESYQSKIYCSHFVNVLWDDGDGEFC